MKARPSLARSWTFARRHVRFALLALVVAALAGVANAATSTKFYEAAFSPSTAARSTTAEYTLKLANTKDSTQTLGSANFRIPTDKGFTVTSPALGATPTPVTASDGVKRWTVAHAATSSGRVLQFRAVTSGDALAPEQFVAAPIVVTTSCDAQTASWPSIAKQANNFSGPPGNDFTLTGTGAVLTVTSGGAAPAKLEFVQQPTLTEKNAAITPAVTVKLVDGCGATTTSSQNVSIAFDNNPTGAALGGGGPQSLASGTATFSGLTVDKSGVGYTLRATASGLAPATSDAFDVVDSLCTPEELPPGALFCTATDSAGTTVQTTRPPSNGSMAFTFSGLGTNFTCTRLDDSTTTRDTVGAQTTLVPKGYATPIDLIFVWDGVVPQGGGVANYVFCLSKTGGLSYFEVPLCNKRATNLPCELSRNSTGVATLELRVRIGPNDPIGSLG